MHCGDGADQLPPGALQPARVAARALSGTTSSAYNNMSTSLAVHSQLAQSEGPKVLQTKWQPLLLLSTLSARCVHSGSIRIRLAASAEQSERDRSDWESQAVDTASTSTACSQSRTRASLLAQTVPRQRSAPLPTCGFRQPEASNLAVVHHQHSIW